MSDPWVSKEPEFDGWGRYKLPALDDDGKPTGKNMPYTRVSTVARAVMDEFALNQWKIRQTIAGIGKRPDLQALAATCTDPDRDRKTLESIARQAEATAESEKGANIGTAIHAGAQMADQTGDVPDGLVAPYVIAYRKALADARLTIVPDAIERVVALPMKRSAGILENTAGRYDRVVRLADGTYAILDIKSAKKDSIGYAWHEIKIQQAIYSRAPLWWVYPSSYVEPLPVRQDIALIAHVPQDVPAEHAYCEIYAIDIEAGWRYALTAWSVREQRKQAKEVSPYVVLDVATSDHEARVAAVRQARTREDLSALWRLHQDDWTEELTVIGQARLREIEGGE